MFRFNCEKNETKAVVTLASNKGKIGHQPDIFVDFKKVDFRKFREGTGTNVWY